MFICLSLPCHKNVGSKKVKIFVCFIHQCIQDTHILRYWVNRKIGDWILMHIHSWRLISTPQLDSSIATSRDPFFSLYQGLPCCTCSSPPHPEQHSFMLRAIWVTVFASALIILREPESLYSEKALVSPSASFTAAHTILLRQSQQPAGTLNNVRQH